jgi:uncharacterized membrane protein YidH (DUF202 family)
MKSKFLFPTWCSIVGYLLSIPGFILGYLYTFNNYLIPGFGFKMRDKDRLFKPAFENFTDELAVFLVVVGLILIAFSKNKREDELNAKVRLNALYWSIMIYYILLIVNTFWGTAFGEIPFVGEHIFELNIFMPLVIFIARYSYLSISNKESYAISEPKFLPNKPFKAIGVILSTIGLFLLIYTIFYNSEWIKNADDYAYGASLLGLFIWSFSQHKTEDEMTMQLRLESLQLAVYINYGMLLLATLIVYSLAYLFVLGFATLSFPYCCFL